MRRYCIGRILVVGLSLVATHVSFGVEPKVEPTPPASGNETYTTGKANATAARKQSQRNEKRRYVMKVVREGNTAELKQLLDTAQSTEIADALRWAVVFKQTETARLILDTGYDASQDRNSNYTLNMAINNNDTEMVRLLVNKGLAMDMEGKRGRDPLDNARRRGNQEIIDILVSAKGSN